MRPTSLLVVVAAFTFSSVLNAREAVLVREGFLPSLERLAKEAEGEEAGRAAEMLDAAKEMMKANTVREPRADVTAEIQELAGKAKGETRHKDITRLASFGEPALLVLSEILLSGDADAGADAAGAIAVVNSKLGTPALVQALVEGPGKVRWAAAQALGELKDARSLPFLRHTQAEMMRLHEEPDPNELPDTGLIMLQSECYEVIEKVEKANFPPEKKALQRKLKGIEGKIYDASEKEMEDKLDFAKVAEIANELLPEIEAVAAGLPEDDWVECVLEEVRTRVEHDGAGGALISTMYNAEDRKKLWDAGIRVVAWTEKSNLRVGVANFGQAQQVRVQLAYEASKGRGRKGKTYLHEVAETHFKLAQGEVRVVRFNGIPKRPEEKKQERVDDEPICVVSAGTGPQTVTSTIYLEGMWESSEYVTKGDEVTIDFHAKGTPPHFLLVHVLNHFVAHNGKRVPCTAEEKEGVSKAPRGWFADNVDFSVTVPLKGFERPAYLDMKDIYVRSETRHRGRWRGRHSDITYGPRIITVPKDTEAEVVDVELPASKRIDPKPLSEKPKERAEQLAARLRMKWLPWNAASEAADELAEMGDVGAAMLAELVSQRISAERIVRAALARTGNRKAMEKLLGQLDHERWDKGRDAAFALAEMGEVAVEPLLAVLKTGTPNARASAVVALGGIAEHRPSAVILKALIACLEDPDTHVRRRAVEMLGRIGAPEAAPALTKCLDDPDETVRKWAAGALGRVRSENAIGPLLAKLENENVPESEKRSALHALMELRAKEATPACVRMLQSGEPRLKHSVLRAMLYFADERAADALISELDDGDTEIRWMAARVLGRTGAKKAIEPLIERLSDNDETVRFYAAESLQKLGVAVREVGRYRYSLPEPSRDMTGEMRKKSTEGLVAAFSDNNWQARRTAIREVRRRRDAFPFLLKAVKDERAQVRLCAVRALERLRDQRASAAVSELLDDPDGQVRRKAAEVFSKRAGPRDEAAWLKALESNDWSVRTGAAVSLGDMKAVEAAPRLRELIFDRKKEVRIAAIEALGKMRDVEAVPLFMEALRARTERSRKLYGNDDYRPRRGPILAIKNALVSIGEPAVEQVVSLYQSGWGDHSALATAILVEIGEPARTALVEAAESGERDLVEGAAAVLARLGGKGTIARLFGLIERDQSVEHSLIDLGKGAIPEILPYLEKGTKKQKWAAAFVLAKLGDNSGKKVLLDAMAAGKREVLKECAWMFKEIGTPEDVPALIEALKYPYCPQSVMFALREIDDKRIAPAVEPVLFRSHEGIGYYAAEILFERTGKKHKYVDHNGIVKVWGEENPQAPTAVEAGLAGGKPTVKFDFEDGTAMGWQVGEAAGKRARGKFSLFAPPQIHPRFKSPVLVYRIGEDSWFSTRIYADKDVIVCARFQSDGGRQFSKAMYHDGKGWQGFACPLVGLHEYGNYEKLSKVGEAINFVQMRVQSRSALEIPLYLDDVIISGGEGGIAEEQPPKEVF